MQRRKNKQPFYSIYNKGNCNDEPEEEFDDYSP